jgi:hypothetical protein
MATAGAAAGAAAGDVINWDDAMAQCGDDEEFLRELLGDLRSEAEAQLQTIAAIIQVGGRRGRRGLGASETGEKGGTKKSGGVAG